MGTGTSKHQTNQSQRLTIEHDIAASAIAMEKSVKILLLGASDSGKSTVMKQFRLIHDKTFPMAELLALRSVVYSNCLSAATQLIGGSRKINSTLIKSFKEDIHMIEKTMAFGGLGEPITEECCKAVQNIWNSTECKKLYSVKNQFRLMDSAQYFLNNIGRIAAVGYTPSEDDVLHARSQTTGIVENKILLPSDIILRIIDVGVQRSERRKWIHCFDDVGAVIFVVGLSEFDMPLYEEELCNSMQESLDLFGWICQLDCFKKVSIILFLNKTDLFREKIDDHIGISKVFPQYRGPCTYRDSLNYIRDQFLSRLGDHSLYIHETCATDKTQVQAIITNVVETVLRKTLINVGL